MLDNIARIETYTEGLTREAFAADHRTRDAVERCLERICEGAYRLGDRAAQLAPNQPWPDIRGMGNRHGHAYDRTGRQAPGRNGNRRADVPFDIRHSL